MPLPLHADYEFSCPVGQWPGKLDGSKWGKAQNLILYFTSQEDGARYWLSTFQQDNYGPKDKGMSFNGVEPGGVYILTTCINAKGKPVLLSARSHEPSREPHPFAAAVPDPKPLL